MKVSILDGSDRPFRPVTISITIESRDELQDLRLRLGMSKYRVADLRWTRPMDTNSDLLRILDQLQEEGRTL
jgi:hypothetical protein